MEKSFILRWFKGLGLWDDKSYGRIRGAARKKKLDVKENDMTTAELISMIISFVLAGICAFISICQFAEKGFLFNNAYIWKSKDERERMDKKMYYRQSAIVFCLLSAVFLVVGISSAILNIILLEIPLIICTLVYAIVSSMRIEKHRKQ